MSRWRDLAKRLQAQEGGRDETPMTAAMACPAHIVPIVPIVPRGISRSVSPSDPAAWSTALAALNTSRPPAGMSPDRWRTLLGDARWLAHQHGEAAAAFGWTASDLFGVRGSAGWGGFADRLDGARDVQFDARRVRWSHGANDWAVLIRMARTGRLALLCGAPLWELAR